jgi:DNA-binding beta-propeller fold protein YncE
VAKQRLGATVATSAVACQNNVLQPWFPPGTHPRFVVVVDIGQGNCNVVFDDDGRPIIYYDMGGGTRGSQFTRPAPRPVFCLDVNHSLFIVSHWDDDHYITLDEELAAGHLVGLDCLAPRQSSPPNLKAKKSATAGAVANALADNTAQGGELYLWRDQDPAAVAGPVMATQGEFSVIRVTHTNINNTGLAVRLTNPAAAGQYMLLTGDATFERYQPAGPDRRTFEHACNGHCVGLVAGHHGSHVGRATDIPRPDPLVNSHLIAYSFGWGNQHAHPDANGVTAYESRGWSDDHRMDTGGAEVGARYAGPRGNVGLVWPNAVPGPAKPPPVPTPLQIDRAAVALLAATAAEVKLAVPNLAYRARVAAGAAYQAALESDAAHVAAALINPAGGTPLATVAGNQGAVVQRLGLAIAAAPAAAAVIQPLVAQELIARLVDCVAAAAASGARELTSDVRYEVDVRNGSASSAAKAAYGSAAAPETAAVMAAAIPDGFVQRALQAVLAYAPLVAQPTAAALRTAVATAVAAAMQGRIGIAGPGTSSQQPWQAAQSAAVAIAAFPHDDLVLIIAAAAGCTPAVPIDPSVGQPETLTDNENSKILQRVAAAAALAGPAGASRRRVARAAAAAARVGFAAAQGAPQVGCHRHPRTCVNGPCSLSVHYLYGMFPARIRTEAGSAGLVHGGDGLAPTAAAFTDPRYVLQDGGLALYISDTGAHRIRRTGTDATIGTLAGTIAGAGYGGDANAPALTASFHTLAAVAFDEYRNQLYVADSASNKVRRVDLSANQVSRVAGTGVAGSTGDNGPATLATLRNPGGLAYDGTSHALYIADTGNHCVRKVDLATGIISTVAGQAGVAADGADGLGTGSQLDTPRGLACADGVLYIADTGNHRVRTLLHGQLARLAGTGAAGAGANNLAAGVAHLDRPEGVALGVRLGHQTVLIADTGNHRIREIRPNGKIYTLNAGLNNPVAVGSDPAGDVLIADSGTDRIYRYTRSTNARAVLAGGAGNLSGPCSLHCGPARAYLADAGNFRVKSLTYAGIVANVAGNGHQGDVGDAISSAVNAQLNSPGGLAYDPKAHALYLADTGNNCVRRIDLATGGIFLIAGQPNLPAAYAGHNVAATAARLSSPTDLVFDGVANALYIADTGSNRVRAVSLATGLIRTVAGTGLANFSGDGLAATAAELDVPVSVTADANGNVFIGTSGDHRVRRIDRVTGDISTWAGTGVAGAGGNGLAPTNVAVQLDDPAGLAADNAGNLYISCTGSPEVRLVNAAGTRITKVAGTGAPGFGGDGGDPALAVLDGPRGIHVDEAGRNLFIADAINHRIRRACL